MNSQEYLEKIKKYFAYLVTEIRMNTACGHFDINTVAENFYIPILKILYGCEELENKNIISTNFPSIDLGCEKSRKSFQVTSQGGSAKIIETLRKFRENKLEEKYDEVYILVITEKQKTYSSTLLINEIQRQKIHFDISSHIIDCTDLLSTISYFDIKRLKLIYELLEMEFTQHTTFDICRAELDNIIAIGNRKIDVEKKTKKYIPSIYTEPTKTKDLARLFSHPLYFYRKIEDILSSIDYDSTNRLLTMMGVEEIASEIPAFVENNTPSGIQDVLSYLDQIKEVIATEKEKTRPYGGRYSDKENGFYVPAGKQAIKSLLKLKRESHFYGLQRRYDEVLALIDVCVSKVFLITSMAGQGKTNFVCDLIENLFEPFEIPSVFLPARELNSYNPPSIFSYLKKNRYLTAMSTIYELLGFFDRVAKEVSKPFIIVIDGMNEVKDLDGFNSEMRQFLEDVSQYDYVRVIVTCRSEFFDRKYSSLLDQPFSQHIYHVSDLKSEMSDGNLQRILESYLRYFDITVRLSEEASSFLKDDLLLLRIFCESNQGKDIGSINEIYKDQLYEAYLISLVEGFDDSLKSKALSTLYVLAERMISTDQYTGLVLDSLDEDAARIVEQLVADDIILRRELPVVSLETAGLESVSFIYDELRDFIIAYYLVKKLSVEDFGRYSDYFARLPELQVHEGVFKYLYIMSRKESLDDILSMCEGVDNFDEHYSIILSSLPSGYQSTNDVERVESILGSADSRLASKRVALYLYNRRSTTECLNITILVDYINDLNDKELEEFLLAIFSDDYLYDYHSHDHIHKYVEGGLNIIRGDQKKIDNNVFKFLLQVTTECRYGLQAEMIVACTQIKERGERLECFEYIEQSKSSKVRDYASKIKTHRESMNG